MLWLLSHRGLSRLCRGCSCRCWIGFSSLTSHGCTSCRRSRGCHGLLLWWLSRTGLIRLSRRCCAGKEVHGSCHGCWSPLNSLRPPVRWHYLSFTATTSWRHCRDLQKL